MGSVLLIVHFLTAAEQGYYYALWSLVALQSVFELGFSFVILQVAAHETRAPGVSRGRKHHGQRSGPLQACVAAAASGEVVHERGRRDGNRAADGRDEVLLDASTATGAEHLDRSADG